MAEAIFEVDFSGGLGTRMHEQRHSDIGALPWGSLDTTGLAPDIIERGRITWTENAFNEFCTGAALAQLVHEMAGAMVPLDLWAIAARFPEQEVLHVELCGRMAMELGGGAPLVYDTDDLVIRLDPALSPLQRVNELVVRLCCVGEVFSLPMLTGAMRASTHPLTRAVLTRIVRDEALHGALGWMYLDWVGSELDAAERARLGSVARDTGVQMSEFWERLRGAGELSDEEARQWGIIGWMLPHDYIETATRTMRVEVFERLESYGIG